MADVTPDMPSTSPAERGQLILVTALALAILFVSLALIVNTAIYTENLATRGSDVGGGTEAVRYHDSVQSGVGGLIELANDNETLNGDNESLQTELRAGVATIDNRSASQFALSNRAVEAQLDTTVNGTRIAQTDDRNFTNESDEPDWTVVEGVNNTRNLVINISSVDSGADFRLNLTNTSGETWVLNVTDGGGSTVGVTNGTDAEFTCSGDSTPVIDVTGGTVDGDACDGLVLAEGIDTPYDISIENGDHLEGTYSMVVDNDSLADDVADDDNDHFAAGDQPTATHAIYSANVTVTYQTPRLYYNATVRVAPGEPDG